MLSLRLGWKLLYFSHGSTVLLAVAAATQGKAVGAHNLLRDWRCFLGTYLLLHIRLLGCETNRAEKVNKQPNTAVI
mgnify:CR=1 FL=1